MHDCSQIPFNYCEFIEDFPEFSEMSKRKVTNTFNYAAKNLGQAVSTIWCDNNVKYYWLTIVLAHILTPLLNGTTGRLNSVSQGSESAGFDFNAPDWASYWITTPYGQLVYEAIIEFLAGGHYISNGEVPYLGESMNPGNEINYFGDIYGPF